MPIVTPQQAQYYAHLLTSRSVGDRLESLSQSLLSAAVDINPHQVEAALFAFRSPLSKGVVLADEVGLGKTIEAGLVIGQYWAVGKRKIIVVCPASLRKQWSAELTDKFGLPNIIVDSRNFRQVGFGKNRIVVCSYNFVARYKVDILRRGFELAVVDEAHKLRNVYRQSAKTAIAVRDALSGTQKLLLTATPFQNSLMELYGLVSIINPTLFGSEKAFRSTYARGEENAELRRRIAPLFTRTLRRDVREYINYTNRHALTQKFQATDTEQQLYSELSDFLRRDDIYSVPTQQRKLTTMIVRKILASSTYALIFTLTHIRQRLQRMLTTLRVEPLIPDELIEAASEETELFEPFSSASGEQTCLLSRAAEWCYGVEPDELLEEDIAEAAEESDEVNPIRLKAEIAILDRFIEMARGIDHDSKSDALLKALTKAFKQQAAEGAPRKAIIFTESTRTQDYLVRYLEAHGYAGRLVIFNGRSSDPQTTDIYNRWCRRHPDRVSGVRTADRRAAVVDYFEHQADIMIATEAAAEGLNLQFCSLVVNYDLPWNPQRIEQRIGRCHRYGQKHDVVVVNFINTRNFADVRVFNLLSDKFHLFDDVFGASDEVLGRVDSLDIESRIYDIYQQCRTEAEIQAAFHKLQADMQAEIDERMDSVRQEVLDHFDIDVQEHLRMTHDTTGLFLNRYEYLFWELTKYVLHADASFDDEQHTFHLQRKVAGCPAGLYRLFSQQGDGIAYRLSHPLAQHVLREALTLPVNANGALSFSPQATKLNVQMPDDLRYRSGWLLLSRLQVDSLDEEQHLLFTAFTDDGRFLTQEECERLMLLGAQASLPVFELTNEIQQKLQSNQQQHTTATLHEIDSRNTAYFRQEEERIFNWERDMVDGLEVEIKTIKNEILRTEREARNAQTVAEKLTLEKKVDELKRRRRRLRSELEEREDEVSEQRKTMIRDLERRMIQNTASQDLFTIRFTIE